MAAAQTREVRRAGDTIIFILKIFRMIVSNFSGYLQLTEEISVLETGGVSALFQASLSHSTNVGGQKSFSLCFCTENCISRDLGIIADFILPTQASK